MWTRLRNKDRSKYPLTDGKVYKVRMVEGCGDTEDDDDDRYWEVDCRWNFHYKLWITVEGDIGHVYEWIDMDDVWIED